MRENSARTLVIRMLSTSPGSWTLPSGIACEMTIVGMAVRTSRVPCSVGAVLSSQALMTSAIDAQSATMTKVRIAGFDNWNMQWYAGASGIKTR
jgi:hypothetical protein